MKLVPYNVKDIKMGGRSDNYSIIEQFIESGHDCAKIEGWTQKNATGCVASLNTSIKRYRRFTIKAIERDGEVYLIRKEILK